MDQGPALEGAYPITRPGCVFTSFMPRDRPECVPSGGVQACPTRHIPGVEMRVKQPGAGSLLIVATVIPFLPATHRK